MAEIIRIVPILPQRDPIPKSEKVRAALVRAMRNVVSEGQRKIAEYPPQVLTQTGYVRTGTLKRSWNSDVMVGSQIVGVIFSNANIAPYNIVVQGPGGMQRSLFAGAGWLSVTTLAGLVQADLQSQVQAAIISGRGEGV